MYLINSGKYDPAAGAKEIIEGILQREEMNMNDKFYEANLKATTALYTPLKVRPIDHTSSTGNVITDSGGRTICYHCKRANHTESTCWAKYPHLKTRVGKRRFPSKKTRRQKWV